MNNSKDIAFTTEKATGQRNERNKKLKNVEPKRNNSYYNPQIVKKKVCGVAQGVLWVLYAYPVDSSNG